MLIGTDWLQCRWTFKFTKEDKVCILASNILFKRHIEFLACIIIFLWNTRFSWVVFDKVYRLMCTLSITYDDRHASSDDHNARYCARGCLYRIIFFLFFFTYNILQKTIACSIFLCAGKAISETRDILNMYKNHEHYNFFLHWKYGQRC